MNELGSDDIDDDEDDDVVENDEDIDKDVVVDTDDVVDTIDLTGEMNVESLVAKLDATPKDDLERKRQIRKRLEELREEREELESTYNFNLDDEL
jgi:hypothetical protein